jgi:two-component system OmpR family sensor kinase
MSIRLRLTLLYSAILALTLIAFSTILYVSQTQTTYAGIKGNLLRQAGVFANGIGRFPGQEGRLRGDTGALEPPPPVAAGGAPAAGGTLPGRWTQTRSITGTLSARTFDLSGAVLPLSSAGLRSVKDGAGWFETAQVQEQPLLIYSQSFTLTSGAKEIVQVAFPIALTVQSLDSLRLVLIAGSSLAILAAFAIGWGLAGAALRPIQRITQTAQTIGAEHNFGRRVEHLGPSDEVGQLALTFNDMLAELETAYRQLEGALDSQRRFVADASHELRTPLTTVRGNIELLRHEPPLDAQERAEVIADTRDEVDRLIRLVNQLLVLARADAGQQLRREPLPVKPLLEDVCRQLKVLAPQSSVLCDPPPDLQVLGDRDALKQVLLALVDNALVHTSPGTAIYLSSAPDGECIAISVRDTGPGIPPETLPRIFERFYRGDVSRTGNGSGLGLAIARELVEGQGGAIAVESRLGQGTVFTITLPTVGNG